MTATNPIPGPEGAGAPKVKKPDPSHTEQYECLICDTKQIEQKNAKLRASRIRCRHCGGAVYPVVSVPEKPVVVRRCKDCNTLLRTTNGGTRCSVCADR